MHDSKGWRGWRGDGHEGRVQGREHVTRVIFFFLFLRSFPTEIGDGDEGQKDKGCLMYAKVTFCDPIDTLLFMILRLLRGM